MRTFHCPVIYKNEIILQKRIPLAINQGIRFSFDTCQFVSESMVVLFLYQSSSDLSIIWKFAL